VWVIPCVCLFVASLVVTLVCAFAVWLVLSHGTPVSYCSSCYVGPLSGPLVGALLLLRLTPLLAPATHQFVHTMKKFQKNFFFKISVVLKPPCVPHQRLLFVLAWYPGHMYDLCPGVVCGCTCVASQQLPGCLSSGWW
jgi:hypothetical protein